METKHEIWVEYPSGLRMQYYPSEEQNKEAMRLMDEGKEMWEAFDIVMKKKAP
jgi:hypothetical protein